MNTMSNTKIYISKFRAKTGISLLALGMLLLLTRCETPIDVKLPAYEPKLVIEGTIENGQPAIVFLSKSIPYFAEISPDWIQENFLIADAEVTVTSSDGESEQLTFQFCYDAPFYMAYVSRQLKGKENTSYTLTVKYNNKTYTALTTIPHTFEIDSAWFDVPSEYINADTMRAIRILMTDNPTEDNYYSYKIKVACPKFKDRLWVSTVPIAFDDKTFNGLTFNYELERYGVPSLVLATMTEEERKAQSRITFRPGDTVYIKNSLMDYNSYRFMMTGGNEAVMGSNPFTNPAPVFSNIQGDDVLGAWCGFASVVTRLVWPDTIGYYGRRLK